MAKVKGAIVVNTEGCKGCGLCVASCPTKTIALAKDINSKGFNYCEMIEDNCIACMSCALVCPDVVITVYKQKPEQAG